MVSETTVIRQAQVTALADANGGCRHMFQGHAVSASAGKRTECSLHLKRLEPPPCILDPLGANQACT